MATYEYKQRLADHIRLHYQEEGDQRLEMVFRFLLLPRFNPGDPIAAGALVEMELEGSDAPRSLAFLVPTSGGLITSLDQRAVQVVTDQSPIGSALLGRTQGEVIDVEIRGGVRRYRLIEVC